MLTFGSFRLFPAQSLLLEGDTPVRIGSRALDILTALAERAGELVAKEELLEYAWPNTTVAEANLRVHVAGLRKLLGDGQMGVRYIGEIAAGLETINRAIDAARRCEESWCVAELLRIKGEILLKQGGALAATSGEECFRGALDWARGQKVLSWELRVATSYALLWHDQGRSSDARELLSSTYRRFTEGFSTIDLRAAKALLDELT